MVGDKGPLSLLALQKSLADQTVDGLADGDDAYAVFSRQLGLCGQAVAGVQGAVCNLRFNFLRR